MHRSKIYLCSITSSARPIKRCGIFKVNAFPAGEVRWRPPAALTNERQPGKVPPRVGKNVLGLYPRNNGVRHRKRFSDRFVGMQSASQCHKPLFLIAVGRVWDLCVLQ